MLITPHALTGSAIAVLIPNPVISIPLAVGSHFILDVVPHWQETLYPYKPTQATWIRLPVDLSLSLGLVYWITTVHPDLATNIWLTSFTANVPDLDSTVSLIPSLLKIKALKIYWNWHNSLQRETDSWLGLVPQLIVSGICLILTFLPI